MPDVVSPHIYTYSIYLTDPVLQTFSGLLIWINATSMHGACPWGHCMLFNSSFFCVGAETFDEGGGACRHYHTGARLTVLFQWLTVLFDMCSNLLVMAPVFKNPDKSSNQAEVPFSSVHHFARCL